MEQKEIDKTVIGRELNKRGINPTIDELLDYRSKMTTLLTEVKEAEKKDVELEIKVTDYYISKKSSE